VRKNTKIVLILIALLVIGILIYQSPDEAYWLKEDSRDAFEIAKTYAWYLFYGSKQGLLKVSIDPAKTKIEKSNIQEISDSKVHEQLRKIRLDPESLLKNQELGKIKIVSPLLAEGNSMELVILERMENFIVMTFGYEDNDRIVEIPGKGKMLFSVGVRYYKPIDKRIVYRIIRKVANIPLLRNFTGKMGTTGGWVVFDYNYKYNRADYLSWVLIEGENLSKNHDRKLEEFLAKSRDKESLEKWKREIEDRADRSLNFLYEWGSMAVEEQIERIENLHSAQRRIKSG